MSASAILLKLQPNQDITLALEEAVRDAGFARARIWAAVGSLLEGVLERDGEIVIVEGPAIEIAALSGEVAADGSTAPLHGHLCCDDTHVVSGSLIRGRNTIAVTFEVLLEELADA